MKKVARVSDPDLVSHPKYLFRFCSHNVLSIIIEEKQVMTVDLRVLFLKVRFWTKFSEGSDQEPASEGSDPNSDITDHIRI